MKNLLLLLLFSASAFSQSTLINPQAIAVPAHTTLTPIFSMTPVQAGMLAYSNQVSKFYFYKNATDGWETLMNLPESITLNKPTHLLQVGNLDTSPNINTIYGISSSSVGGAGVRGEAQNYGSISGNTYGVYGKNITGTGFGYGVYGEHTGAGQGVGVGGFTNNGTGVFGESNVALGVFGKSASGTGVYGVVTQINPTFHTRAVSGLNSSTNGFGYGVYGSHAGSGVGGFFTASSTGKALITENGKVGFGTLSPTKSFMVVDGKVGASHAIFGENTSGVSIESDFPGISFNGYYNAGRKAIVNGFVGGMALNPSDGTITIYSTSTTGTAGNNTAPFDRITILNNGNTSIAGTVTASCGVLVCSDFRFKKNIIPLNNSLANVLKINGVAYSFRQNEFPERNFSDKKQIGFIAQEIEKIYPEMVFVDEKGYKSVDYAKITPVLVEAIKDQQKQIEELKMIIVEIDKLKSEWTSFKSSLLKNEANVSDK